MAGLGISQTLRRDGPRSGRHSRHRIPRLSTLGLPFGGLFYFPKQEHIVKKRLIALTIGVMLVTGCSSTPFGAFCYIPADRAGQCQVVQQPAPTVVPITRGRGL